MPGANDVIRVIAAVVTLFVLVFITGVGVELIESVSTNMDTPKPDSWESLDMMFWAGLGIVGLAIVVIVWLIYAPIKQDVRQNQRPPPRT